MTAAQHIIHSVFLGTLAFTTPALAQTIDAEPPEFQGAIPESLSNCTAEALNVNGFVDEDGNVSIANVPASVGPFQVTVVCEDALGETVIGYSEHINPTPNTVSEFTELDFDTLNPVPETLDVQPAFTVLTGAGTTAQLSTVATLPDGTNLDISADAGTTYGSTNDAVVTVGPDGLLTAVGSGSAAVRVSNNGILGVANVLVLSAPIQSLDVTPPAIELMLNPAFPGNPRVELQVDAILGDGSRVDVSNSFAGTSFNSSTSSVAAVGSQGQVIALSPGSATITISHPETPSDTNIPVTISNFDPYPVDDFNTPGNARDVVLDGSLAYVADGGAGLQVIDVDGLSRIGSLALGNTIDVAHRGDNLVALALSTSGAAIVDVSDPSAPAELSRVTDIANVQSIALNGDLFYVVGGTSLSVYDISDPVNPVSVGGHALSGSANAVAADSARGVALVAVSTPAVDVIRLGVGPWTTATVPLPAATNHADDVTLLGATGYVANGRDGVRKLDLTNIDAPVLIPKRPNALNMNALGIAVHPTPDGDVVAAADNLFFNHVPLFNSDLINTTILDFSSFSDANGSGVALGPHVGVVSAGSFGIQVFRYRPIVDNAGVMPVVSISSPVADSIIEPGQLIHVLTSDDVSVERVEFFVDGVSIGTDTAPPFSMDFPDMGGGTFFAIGAVAYDYGGNPGTALPIVVTYANECGDSILNTALGEECDEGGIDTATCDSDCTLPECGDGLVNVNAGEECDPPSLLCSAICESTGLFITNGSFEAGDYFGWTLQEVTVDPDHGIFGIGNTGTILQSSDMIQDYGPGGNDVSPSCLNIAGPLTLSASDGASVGFHLQRQAGNHRMFQDVYIPLAATKLVWEMLYRNAEPFEPVSQFIAVHIRDVTTDAILTTLYKATQGDDPETLTTMTTFEVDIGAYADQTIRIDFELQNQDGCLDTVFDNFRLQ